MAAIRLQFLVALLIALLVGNAQAQDVVGVWRTVNASDAEGKQQKGVVFRKDGTGEFLSPTTAIEASEEMRKLLDHVTAGSTNMRFTYSRDAGVVSITITHFGGLPVSKSNAVQWKAERPSPGRLKLSATDGSGKWIELDAI